MSEKTPAENKNIFKYSPTDKGCCDIFMGSTETEETIKFPSEIDGLRVTGIGRGACRGCENVKAIFVPEGVCEIGPRAFYDCPNLLCLHLPSTLNGIITMSLFYENNISLITCTKGKERKWDFDEVYLPQTKVTVLGCTPSADKEENGTVGIYTVCPFETENEIVFQKELFLRVNQYEADKVNKVLSTVKQSYELVCESEETYDVYSSDGVDPNDRNVKTTSIEITLKNLVFSENGECCGIFYKDSDLDCVLFFDGRKIGLTSCFDRKRYFGHPLDYFVNTRHSLILRRRSS